MQLSLTLPVPTSLNKLYVSQYKFNPATKRREPTGARVLSKEGLHNKQLIQKYTKQQMKKQVWDYEFTKTNYVYLDTVIYFPRKGRDDNNVYKILCDALEGIVYDNDSRVLIRTQRILYDNENPRVEVSVKPVDYIGIFDNKLVLEEFENRCKSCNRYGRNCSILNKAKEGKIQEEISNQYICSKYHEKSTK